MGSDDGVRLETDGVDARVGIVRVARPPVNAFSQRMWDEFAAIGEELHARTDLRSVVIVGQGAHFGAGADVAEMLSLSSEDFDRRNRVLQGAFAAIATAPQVTIAAIRGYALGGGCELALAADFRYGDGSAALGLPEITLGIIPGSGGTQRLPRLIGVSRAKDLIYTGRVVRAEESLRLGLIDRIVEGDVLEAALQQARAFAAGPAALRQAKASIEASFLPIGEGLAREAELIAQARVTHDGRHGMQSFVEQGPRKAVFIGR